MNNLAETIYQVPEVQDAIDVLNYEYNHKSIKYDERVQMDNWDFPLNIAEIKQALKELNETYTEFKFEFSGDMYRPDLIITHKKAKERYDAIPKTKTYGDVIRCLEKDSGITSDLAFHVDVDKLITDEQYEEMVTMYSKVFNHSFVEDDSDDDL